MNPRHILLAYSGGLDTSAGLHYLKKRFNCRITAYCADLGQEEDWERLEHRATSSGADDFVLADLKDIFINDYVFPALKANAAYERCYLLGTPLARPAIVSSLIEYARQHDVDYLSHGCTQKGNDQIRFEIAAKYLAPGWPTIAPWRIWSMKSREDLLEYCQRHEIPIENTANDLLSHDENLVHITTEGGYLEDIGNKFKWENARWITPPTEAPDKVETVKITFSQGVPVAIADELISSVDLVRLLNRIGGRNGVGLQDITENRINGIKVRGIFENPALSILHSAHQHLEKITMSKNVERVRNSLVDEYGDIVYRGLWFSEERKCIQALIDAAQKYVSGDVWVELYKGVCRPVAVHSDQSLYSQDLVSLHEGQAISADDAEGFLNTINIPISIEATRRD